MSAPKKKRKAKTTYIKPKITVEKISVTLFRKNSLMNDISEFNLLSATSVDSDDY